ncbi:MAG: hypothetical protein IT521_00915 [Burkholderiales bacterium]|nr:hypothetical protein [Burkholderiales bacterium]
MKLARMIVLTCFYTVASSASAADYYDEKKGSSYNHAAPDEIIHLPKYCWGHYNQKLTNPKYHINKSSCGPWMNHFCQAILQFNRSQNPLAGKMERQGYLNQSIGNLDYSIKGLKDYPACYIRKHVLMMQKRVRMAASVGIR